MLAFCCHQCVVCFEFCIIFMIPLQWFSNLNDQFLHVFYIYQQSLICSGYMNFGATKIFLAVLWNHLHPHVHITSGRNFGFPFVQSSKLTKYYILLDRQSFEREKIAFFPPATDVSFTRRSFLFLSQLY